MPQGAPWEQTKSADWWGRNWNNGTITGYATGSISGTGNQVGGLTGFTSSSGTITGYATGRVEGTGNQVGGLAGLTQNTIFGYWDTTSTNQMTTSAGSSGGGTPITSITNVKVDANGKYYDDADESGIKNGAEIYVFDDTTFLNAFELPGTGAKWPKLKTSFFTFSQPDLP